jgi:uncharacterized DUF497 family protein
MSMPDRQVFEWDDTKAMTNLVKHGVSFPYATRVFLDPARAEWNASRTDDREVPQDRRHH